MAEANSTKCTYFNSGYCWFTRRENGCRYAHPTECCKTTKCNDKRCPFRHPKKCRHGDQCRHGETNCMYKHSRGDRSNIENADNSNVDKIKSLSIEIDTLKSEIVKLKEENDDKINTLARIHLLELNEIQNKNNILKDNLNSLQAKNKEMIETQAKGINELKDYHRKEVNDLKTQNDDLKKLVASSEPLNNDMTKKTEELVQINTYVKKLEANNQAIIEIVNKGNSQKAQIKIKYDNLLRIIADKDKELELQTQKIQELETLVL